MTARERREQLLSVGRALFAEKGFEGTSVEEIAARADKTALVEEGQGEITGEEQACFAAGGYSGLVEGRGGERHD